MASQARSMSRSLHRARPQTDEPVTSAAMARTASKSPAEAMGNPASMISTPSAASARATSSFSAMFMLAPGDCSPSRNVVSKILTRLASATGSFDGAGGGEFVGLDSLMMTRPFPQVSCGFLHSSLDTDGIACRVDPLQGSRGR